MNMMMVDQTRSCDAGLRICVIPPVDAYNQNALFLGARSDVSSHSANTHWMDCFMAVWDRAKELHVEIGTWDILTPDRADIIVGMTQPNSKNDAIVQKRQWPHLKAVLAVWETALGARYVHNPANYSEYDAILTYNQHVVDFKRYFPLLPRAYYRHRLRTGAAFEQRRLGILVGSNRPFKYRSGLNTMRHGWKFSIMDWLDYVFCPGELIRYRASVGKACAVHPSNGFDICGEGWDLLPETKGKCLGIPKGSTLDYLGNYRFDFAFENHSSDCGLISERIWDALWADTVPVYRGHTQIDKVVPQECYIDATQFDSPKDMLEWIEKCPKNVWADYREAGRSFVMSAAVEPYLPHEFANRFLSTILGLAGPAAART